MHSSLAAACSLSQSFIAVGFLIADPSSRDLFHSQRRYRALRRQPNLVLVAGSGLGGIDDTLPYLTGDWSVRFGRPPMPFDGVLLGSRMMVAREARTAPAVKELIVATPGVSDELEWEKSYDGVAGGVITVSCCL